MSVRLAKPRKGSVPIHVVDRERLATTLAALEPAGRAWVQALGFSGSPDTHVLVPGADGRPASVLAGVRSGADPFALASLPKALPAGAYHLAPVPEGGVETGRGAPAQAGGMDLPLLGGGAAALAGAGVLLASSRRGSRALRD
jgi:hypothetical protein